LGEVTDVLKLRRRRRIGWPILNRARQLVGVTAIVWGIAFRFEPTRKFAGSYYDPPRTLLTIHGWGVVFLVLGVCAMLSPHFGEARQIPMIGLCSAWTAYGVPLLLVGFRPSSHEPPTGGITTVALACLALIAVRDTSPYRLTKEEGMAEWRPIAQTFRRLRRPSRNTLGPTP
jgi:hypothetical protein